MRFLFSISLILTIASLSGTVAQSPAPTSDVPWIVPLNVSPSAEPKPALKYLLLPDARDLNPGNQIPAFYKCFMEQHNFYRTKESIDQREKWASAPLQELALEKALIGYGGTSTRQADYAARLESADWATLSQLKVEGIFLLIPDVQQLRELAQVLKVKVRGEIARREFDNAIYTIQTMLSLARSFESHPTLIGYLVGLAIEGIALDVLEEFVQQPAAPNLFWALTDLPNPIISIRNGMAGERVWLIKDFDVLGQHEPLSAAELNKLVILMNKYVEKDKKQTAKEFYLAKGADENLLKAAAERLTNLGYPKDKLAKFSQLHVMMADDFMQYRILRDDLMKWTTVPIAQIPTDALAIKKVDGILTEFIPHIAKVKQAQARLQQRCDLLRIEEAIRAYAAVNVNKLPGSLDQIKLPLPIDPISGKSYRYESKDGKASIRGTAPADRVNDRSFNRVLEISIQK
jgi:hypothetical protein